MYDLSNICFIDFKTFNKKDELLTAYTSNENIPFKLKRIFITGNVSAYSNRGSHAHRETKQIFVCLYGKIDIRCYDGKKKKIYNLTNQGLGIYIPPTIWYDTIYKAEKNSIMVLADKEYLTEDYILEKKEFESFRSNS